MSDTSDEFRQHWFQACKYQIIRQLGWVVLGILCRSNNLAVRAQLGSRRYPISEMEWRGGESNPRPPPPFRNPQRLDGYLLMYQPCLDSQVDLIFFWPTVCLLIFTGLLSVSGRHLLKTRKSNIIVLIGFLLGSNACNMILIRVLAK